MLLVDSRIQQIIILNKKSVGAWTLLLILRLEALVLPDSVEWATAEAYAEYE